MTSIAILLGISKYSDPKDNLPGCVQDLRAIQAIVEGEKRFDDVLVISGSVQGRELKNKLVKFIEKHNGKQIDEVFFYYTGHGAFDGTSFLFVASDYDQRRRNQTALENSELDNIIRNLSPRLYVKIVDACHSGVTYIKDKQAVDEYLKSSQASFKKVYFLFSSHSDQSSYQDSSLSHFTRSIAKAVMESGVEYRLRYKEIIDYASDYFDQSQSQKPYFVTQASFTEVVSSASAETVKELKSLLGTKQEDLAQEGPDSVVKLMMDRIRQNAELYCDEVEAMSALKVLQDVIATAVVPKTLNEVYEFEVSERTNLEVPEAAEIGRWIDSHKEDRYFARATGEWRDDPDVLYVTRMLGHSSKKFFIRGWESKVKLPFSCKSLGATPRYQNLPHCACFIVPIVSMTKIRVFWGVVTYEYVSWSEVEPTSKLTWSTDEAAIKGDAEVKDLAGRIIQSFSEFLEQLTRSKWVPDVRSTPMLNKQEDSTKETEGATQRRTRSRRASQKKTAD